MAIANNLKDSKVFTVKEIHARINSLIIAMNFLAAQQSFQQSLGGFQAEESLFV